MAVKWVMQDRLVAYEAADAHSIRVFALLAGILLVLLIGWRSFRVQMDPQEPMLVSPRLPIIGHNVQILLHGPRVWTKLQLVTFTVNCG